MNTLIERDQTTDAVSVDVVIVGAGACGLVAALAAIGNGASVLLLEKLDNVGGNSTLSTGSIPAAGSRFQTAAGIEDNPALMVADLLAASGPHEAEDLLRNMADLSVELVHWLVDTHGVDLQLITDYKHVGHSVARLHAPGDRDGKYLVEDLVAACQKSGVNIRTSHPVVGLITEGDTVVGVRVAPATGEPYLVMAESVILAAKGYGNNKELLKRWMPEIAKARYFGAPGSTGEAVAWSEELGAALANVSAYQGYAAIANPELGLLLSWTTVEMGAVIVTPAGRRVGDESRGYSGFASILLEHGETAFAVFDTTIRDYVLKNEPRFVRLFNDGLIIEVANVEELAEFIGCESSTLEETIAMAARAAAGEIGDEFGRTNFGFGPMRAPFCVAKVMPGLFHTQGGVRVDAHARVIRPDGSPIVGLFAGGGVAAGVSGLSGAEGYASGNGLLTAVGLGYLAGVTSAQVSAHSHGRNTQDTKESTTTNARG
jgi:fumarate reductase flavoprotein subunit